MDTPTFMGARRTAPDVTTFTGFFPIGPLGILPANSHFIHAREPILVDTNGIAFEEQYLEALRQIIDPADLKWVYVSHTDLDHIGNLDAVLKLAPNARVVVPGLGAAKFGLRNDFDMSRLVPMDHGQRLDLGDRELVLLKPPTYDAPETTGFFDTKTRVLFSVDAFGALLDTPYEETEAIPEATLRDGMTTWAGIDAPWLGMVDKTRLGHLLSDIARLDPTAIISGHLPVTAGGMIPRVLGNMLGALSEDRFAHPDRDSIEALFALPAVA
ncbi:MBL fold metallo-hydrolase [Devosia sp.]|uniref:MBL fold metallo-hydrolase n=1 Tax=Devosia sp. TaxID=1871048 RepID=UPI0035B2F8A8